MRIVERAVDKAARVSVLSILFGLGGAMLVGVLASEAYDLVRRK